MVMWPSVARDGMSQNIGATRGASSVCGGRGGGVAHFDRPREPPRVQKARLGGPLALASSRALPRFLTWGWRW